MRIDGSGDAGIQQIHFIASKKVLAATPTRCAACRAKMAGAFAGIAQSKKCYYSATLKLEQGKPMKVELVTNLKRQATKILAELHLSKQPVLITEHGLPSAYLVDVQDYEFMQRRLELLEGLSRGERGVCLREERIAKVSPERKWVNG